MSVVSDTIYTLIRNSGIPPATGFEPEILSEDLTNIIAESGEVITGM